jgi:nucleoside-diphosphate-sugar epimerase
MNQLLVEDRAPLIVTGSTGRIGRAVRFYWGELPGQTSIWTSRAQGPWPDLLQGDLDPCPRGAIILHLAADLSGGPSAAARTVALAKAVAVAARQGKARHIFLASSAAVYGSSDKDLHESSECQPVGDYGRAKLQSEQVCRRAAGHVPLTILRIGNVVGADGLVGSARPGSKVWLDPVPGWSGGPLRSWIGPHGLATVLMALVRLARAGQPLPPVLNVAAKGALAMADLLTAADLDWDYGPPNPATLARVTLDTSSLADLVPQPPTSARGLIQEWRQVSAEAQVT